MFKCALWSISVREMLNRVIELYRVHVESSSKFNVVCSIAMNKL